MKPTQSFVALALILACRYGGPEGSPTELVDIDDQGEPDTNMGSGEPSAEQQREGDDDHHARDGGGSKHPDARAEMDADAHEEAAPRDAAAGLVDAPMRSCGAPPGLTCDPVSGTGCVPFSQCVVDPTRDAPAASCIISLPRFDANCMQDALSTNCPPQHTCIDNECRKYCYCDSDCGGAACSVPAPRGDAGAAGFKVCDEAP